MGDKIKMPINYLSKIWSMENKSKHLLDLIKRHDKLLLGTGLAVSLSGNIRNAFYRKRDKKTISKQQMAIRKHEAEIKALQNEAEHAKQTEIRVSQLENLTMNMSIEDAEYGKN